MRTAEVSVQSVLSSREVSSGSRSRVGVRGEELHGGAVVGGAGASIQTWKTNKANSVNVPNKLVGPALHLFFEQIKTHFMATGICFVNLHPIKDLCKENFCVWTVCNLGYIVCIATGIIFICSFCSYYTIISKMLHVFEQYSKGVAWV